MSSIHEVSKEKFELSGENIVGFGIFYGDGSSFLGRSVDDWKTAPKENVQLILLYYNEYDELGNNLRHSVCSWDYYAFDGKTFMASNDTRNLCSDFILYGRWMDTDKWKRIVECALEEYVIMSKVVG